MNLAPPPARVANSASPSSIAPNPTPHPATTATSLLASHLSPLPIHPHSHLSCPHRSVLLHHQPCRCPASASHCACNVSGTTAGASPLPRHRSLLPHAVIQCRSSRKTPCFRGGGTGELGRHGVPLNHSSYFFGSYAPNQATQINNMPFVASARGGVPLGLFWTRWSWRRLAAHADGTG
jgi:hypothetical protein